MKFVEIIEKFNPYHSAANGRFTSAAGGGGGGGPILSGGGGKGLWKSGAIKTGNSVIRYQMKQYDEGEGENPFGINNGRISKLTLVREDMTIANYDRGWDIKPKDKEAKQALALILNQYN